MQLGFLWFAFVCWFVWFGLLPRCFVVGLRVCRCLRLLVFLRVFDLTFLVGVVLMVVLWKLWVCFLCDCCGDASC